MLPVIDVSTLSSIQSGAEKWPHWPCWPLPLSVHWAEVAGCCGRVGDCGPGQIQVLPCLSVPSSCTAEGLGHPLWKSQLSVERVYPPVCSDMARGTCLGQCRGKMCSTVLITFLPFQFSLHFWCCLWGPFFSLQSAVQWVQILQLLQYVNSSY